MLLATTSKQSDMSKNGAKQIFQIVTICKQFSRDGSGGGLCISAHHQASALNRKRI